jgi:hypothetical protein
MTCDSPISGAKRPMIWVVDVETTRFPPDAVLHELGQCDLHRDDGVWRRVRRLLSQVCYGLHAIDRGAG